MSDSEASSPITPNIPTPADQSARGEEDSTTADPDFPIQSSEPATEENPTAADQSTIAAASTKKDKPTETEQHTNTNNTTTIRKSPTPSSPITLQVGDRTFTTYASTLTDRSSWFAIELSRWQHNPPDTKDGENNNTFFLDIDPDIFKHTLQYLRCGIFPLLYNSAQGHNFHLYNAIAQQARKFQIEPLRRWIEEKIFLRAIKIVREVRVVESVMELGEEVGVDVEIECQLLKRMQKVYVCPRGIGAHRGRQELCGRQCRNAQEGMERLYEEGEVLRVLEVRKKVVWDQGLCCEGR